MRLLSTLEIRVAVSVEKTCADVDLVEATVTHILERPTVLVQLKMGLVTDRQTHRSV
jgi:hypothetical protein